MTTHYLDIQLRPDPEFPASQLLAALYAKLHRALVQLRAEDLAVSFPGYAEKPMGLGQTLRVLGTAERLGQLMALPWLSGRSAGRCRASQAQPGASQEQPRAPAPTPNEAPLPDG